jgi:hypothetical protein
MKKQLCIIHDNWAGKIHPDDLIMCRKCKDEGMRQFKKEDPQGYKEFLIRTGRI